MLLGRTSIKYHKKNILGKKPKTFCFRKTSFVHPLSGTYYALLFGYFCLKFLPDVLHHVYWVFDEIWAPDSSLKIGNKFFIHHCQNWKEGSFVCETVWFSSWANTDPFYLKFVDFCPKFSGDSYVEFQEKTMSGQFFRNFVQTKAILYRNLWNYALLSEILFWIRIALKKFTQVVSYVLWTQVRTHVYKISQKEYTGEITHDVFFFGKPILFTLGSRLTMPYSLGILVWNYYQTFFTVSNEFWIRFEPQIHPKRLAINFLFITVRTERKVRLCGKLFDIFRGRILLRLTLKLSRFVSNSVEILKWNFRKKTIAGEFFRNFVQTKAILYRILWNFALLFEILFWVRIALK